MKTPPHTATEPSSPVEQKTDSSLFLTLQEFTSGGSNYFRCADEEQRPLLSHLLNGAGSCFFAEELPAIQRVANAHGWALQLLLEKPPKKEPDEFPLAAPCWAARAERYIAAIQQEHDYWNTFLEQAMDRQQCALVAQYGNVCDALKMAINRAREILLSDSELRQCDAEDTPPLNKPRWVYPAKSGE